MEIRWKGVTVIQILRIVPDTLLYSTSFDLASKVKWGQCSFYLNQIEACDCSKHYVVDMMV